METVASKWVYANVGETEANAEAQKHTWGGLCTTGREQSPIDVDTSAVVVGDAPPTIETRISAVLKLERLARSRPSDSEAAAAIGDLFPPSVFDMARGDTAHIYVSAPNAAALANHTDVTDVLVLQVGGSKEWTVCPPPPIIESPESESRETSGPDKLSTCTSYDAIEMAGLERCRTLTLEPGDLLFVPRRSVHSARAVSEGKRVCVHCNGGKGRTGTLVACVLLALRAPGCASVGGATAVMRRCRPGMLKNPLQQLYVRWLRQAITPVEGLNS